MKVEIRGEVSRDVKDCQKPSEARREGRNRFSFTGLKRSTPADILILDFQPPKL